MAQTQRKSWTRDELMVAMHLYCLLPFGRLSQQTPEIQELAQVLERTPSSVAMKLCNWKAYFVPFEGVRLRLPERFAPDENAMAWHRAQLVVYRGLS